MRLVACLIAGLILVTALPNLSSARDDCSADHIAAAPGCVAVPATLPAPAPSKTYYVYFFWVQCPLNQVCEASPPAHLVGIIWEESNNVGGLQRASGGTSPPDTVVLW